MKTIAEIVNDYTSPGHEEALIAALTEREVEIADFIRLAGAHFNLMPPIVQQVVARSGLGVPLSEEEQALLDTQTLELLNAQRRQFNEAMEANGLPMRADLLESLPEELFNNIGTMPEEGGES